MLQNEKSSPGSSGIASCGSEIPAGLDKGLPRRDYRFHRRSTIAAWAVSALFIFLAFRRVEWGEMLQAFYGVDYALVFLGAAMGLTGFLVRALGWKYLLMPVGRLNSMRLFPAVAIGYMANNLLPARLGEFARAYVLGRRENVSKSAVLATIFLERLFDGLTLLMVLAFVSLFFPYPAWVKQGGLIVAAVFVCLSLLLVVMSVKLKWGLWLIGAIFGRLMPQQERDMKIRLCEFVIGLDVKNHWRDTLVALACTLFRWAFEACIYLSVILAMGLGDRVPVHGALFVMVIVNIACLVPQAPGYFGSVQLACIQSLAVFSVGRSEALAYSFLVHAGFFLPITIIGILCLLRSHLSFDDLRGESRGRSRKAAAMADAPDPETVEFRIKGQH